ncbi:MAG: cupin domain-containing protein [Candidatus Paceibacterota bacterium]|jgi:mannose-1-phosphate guanylyltransferase/mannose-6-phosphate isomerase
MEEIKPFEVVRPWGKFRQFSSNVVSSVKIHDVSPLGKSSLQSHGKRAEFWHIISGSGTVQIDEKEHMAHAGDEFVVSQGMKHRWTGGPEGMKVLEIMTGDFVEDDEVRYDDKYGRA